MATKSQVAELFHELDRKEQQELLDELIAGWEPTTALRAELDRRSAELRANPSLGIPLDVFAERMKRKRELERGQ